MPYNTNQFCWHGMISTDPAAAQAFYSAVIGWDTMTVKMGDDDATMFVNAGVPIAHVMTPQMPGVPSHWDNYLRVDDVDASTKAAVANGGTVVVPGTDIPPGRFSVVTSPSGAMLCLFHEADPSSSEHAPDGPGGVAWVELHTTDMDADIAWLKAALGFTVDVMPMPTGDYHILKSGDSMRGGVTQQENPGAPAMWLTWIGVEDVDATVEKAGANGGQVFMAPFDVPTVGRLAVLADPTGGVFGVMKGSEG